MSGRVTIRAMVLAAALLALAGCSYDYLQRTDRVAYSTGNAVKANLERETLKPTSKSRYSVNGLGKNGVVVETSGGAQASE